MNIEYYSHLIRIPLQRAIREKRPDPARSGFILYHDNAPVHMSQLVKSSPETRYRKSASPTLYPDLAICDFLLFLNVNDQLRGIKYETHGVAITVALRLVSCDGLRHTFDAWLRRCHKCIKVKGSYVEKK